MKVFLGNRGNIDFGQHPDIPVYGTKSDFAVPIKSFEEASAVCVEYIQLNDLGSGAWIGGQILDDSMKVIAYISYNGRIWTKETDKHNRIRHHQRMIDEIILSKNAKLN